MKKLILAYILFLSIPLFSQTATGDIETYIGSIINNVPGSSEENFESPNSTQLSNWNTVINFLLENDMVLSHLIKLSIKF